MSIYTLLTPDDIVEARSTEITTGLWSGDTGALKDEVFLDSEQANGDSGEYYFDVYNRNPAIEQAGSTPSEIQFAVTYGHVNGGGAPTLTDDELATLSTRAIYSQYRNLLLNPSETLFTFNGVPSEHIYVINLQRSRIREQLDPGNWVLPLKGTDGTFTFIDNSNQTLGALTANSKAGRVFEIVSGSLTGPSGSTIVSESNTYGLVYPDLGIIVLNPDTLIPLIGATSASDNGGSAIPSVTSPFYTSATITTTDVIFAPITGSDVVYGDKRPAYNHTALFVAINEALKEGDSLYEFRARSAESIASTHYFIRLRNTQYNYSNNPTFFNPDNGVIINPDFRTDPKVYITTVGLYNDQNELLAVAKLSKPVRKSFDEELLLRIRLDF
jgi:hypothetical protein